MLESTEIPLFLISAESCSYLIKGRLRKDDKRGCLEHSKTLDREEHDFSSVLPVVPRQSVLLV